MTSLSNPPSRIVESVAVPFGLLMSAALLFLLEPMVAKMLLPWFGGSAAVWTSCLLFFQTTLCTGYLYAYATTRFLSPRWQRILHGLLLLGSLALLPVTPSARWQPIGGNDPLLDVLRMLTATIGLPFVLLAASGPLLQSWIVQYRMANSGEPTLPYRLFAVSNAGSIMALVSYPALVEPLLPTSAQARLWSLLYCVFVAVSLIIALWTRLTPNTSMTEYPEPAPTKAKLDKPWLWLLLAACPSMLLVSITNHITQNVAGMPLIWVVPLALYLVSFILCFDADRWYKRPLFVILFGELFIAMMYAAVRNRANSDPMLLLALFSAGLFAASMCCHGELAALKPRKGKLTLFYLIIAAGGALGSVLVAAVAPALLPALIDMPIALGATGLLSIFVISRATPVRTQRTRRTTLAIFAIWLVSVVYVVVEEHIELGGDRLLARNFYGALRVMDLEEPNDGSTVRRFIHGTIVHGEEYLDPAKRCEPTTYYAKNSGIGLALQSLQRNGPLKIGVIGLGVGTLAAYARPNDLIDFYELDPLVATIAHQQFSYLDQCGAHASVRLGDGRLSLERDSPQDYDLIVLDAFSGDAIPVHLLTREAFALYWRHLKPDGVIAVHVSNQFVELAPIVARAAALDGKTSRLISNEGNVANDAFLSRWVLVTGRREFFDEQSFLTARSIAISPSLRSWTDDESSLWAVMRW